MSSIAPSSHVTPHSLIPSWLRGKWGSLGIIFIGYIILNLAWTYFHWGGEQQVILIANLLSLPPSLLASAIAWRAAAHHSLRSSERRAWLLLGTSFLMFFIGNLVWAYLEVVLQVEPFPSLADVFYLAFYPLALWGLQTLPRETQDPRGRLTLWLDLLSVLVAATMFVGNFIIGPTAAISNDLLMQLIAAAYPIASLLLISGILAILYRGSPPNAQSALSLLLIGMLFFVGADFAFGYTSLIGTYTPGGWTDVGWNVAQLLFGLAALRKIAPSPNSALTQKWIALGSRCMPWLPRLAIALAYGLVLYAIIRTDGRAAEWLIAGALFLTLLVITRQIVSPGFADLPVRIKVMLTFSMVSVLSICLVSATAYFTIRWNLETLAGENLNAEVKIRAQNLGNEVSQQLDLLEGFVLGETIEYGVSGANAAYGLDEARVELQIQQQKQAWKAASDNDPMIQNILNNLMAKELNDFHDNFLDHSDLLLTDKYGATLAATSRPEVYFQIDEDWWQAAYNQGQGAVYVSQPFIDPAAQDTRVILAVPVRADHRQEVIGILRTTFHIQTVLQTLTPTHLENQPGFNLLLPEGRLINSQGNTEQLDPETIARLQDSQNVAYAQLPFEGMLQLLSQARVVSSDAEDAELLRNLNWTLIAHEKPAATFAPIHAAWRAALLATLFVLFLTSGVAAILAQILIAPIARLTSVVAQMAVGDFTTQAQVESQDEIGTLARTFNNMLAALANMQGELRESEALYRSLVNHSPDMILVHRSGECLLINPAGAKLLGAKSPDEIIGQSILDLLPRDETESGPLETQQFQIIIDPTPLLQRKTRRLDGTNFEAEFRSIPISYAGQQATQYVLRDITERKRAEEKIHRLLSQVARQRSELEIRVEQRTAELNALNQRLQDELSERQRLMESLRDSEARFHLLFEASPDAILLLDPNDANISWPIVDCNEAACTMNGYAREELIGQSIDVLNAMPGDPAERQAYLQFLREQGVLHRDGVHRHKDGHLFPIEVSSSLVSFAGREMVLGIDRDITERKHAEEALRQAKEAAEESRSVAEAANRAKSEFLSRMSHELRTPMNAILGFAQLLEMSRKEPLNSTQKERVKQIVKGGQHLLDLINEILDISRIEANRLHISPEPVSIRESIQEVLDLTVPLAVKHQIQIVTRTGRIEDNSFVLADRQRLKQVLLNLLGNAVKYNFDGGSVIISCEQVPSNRWRISIADTGPGISQENRARLFIPFERLGADQPNVEGTGLGLVLAKRLVELMNGRVGLDSVLGKGSTFWIELPVAENPVERLQRVGGTGKLPVLSAAARTILYVEDNVANFELIRQVLADYTQIELLWAADLKTGLQLASERQLDLVLLDVHLSGMDGGEILQQLKRDGKKAEPPVVVISADATPGQIERLMSWGAHAFLTKPLDVKQFVRLIEELLAEKVV